MSAKSTAHALIRIATDEAFASDVANRGAEALAEYDLTEDETTGLTKDAGLISSEVSGFAQTQIATLGRLRNAKLDPVTVREVQTKLKPTILGSIWDSLGECL